MAGHSQREHDGALGPAGGSSRGCLVRPKPYGVLDLRTREILGRHGVKVAADHTLDSLITAIFSPIPREK